MRMRTEFAHAERKRWRSAVEMAAMKGPWKTVHVLKPAAEPVGRHSERGSENPLNKEEKEISTSARRGSRRRRQVKCHHTRQQRHPPVHSARAARVSPRVRAGSEPAVLALGPRLANHQLRRLSTVLAYPSVSG